MYALQHEVLAAQDIPIQGAGPAGVSLLKRHPVPLYLGLDSEHAEPDRDRPRHSTAIDGEIVFQSSLSFDEALAASTAPATACCRTRSGDRPSSPLMWAEALDVMLARVAKSGVDLVAACRHFRVRRSSTAACTSTRPLRRPCPTRSRRSLVEQLARALSGRSRRSGWTRARRSSARKSPRRSAATTCLRARQDRARSSASPVRRSGSSSRHEPASYAATDRIHLVSSFLASLLIGRARADRSRRRLGHEPDGSRHVGRGGPRRSTRRRRISSRRLPPIVAASAVVGTLSPYWQRRHGLPAATRRRVVGRQPVQPDRHGPGARGRRRHLARHERHDLRPDARAARRPRRAPVMCSARRPASSWG